MFKRPPDFAFTCAKDGQEILYVKFLTGFFDKFLGLVSNATITFVFVSYGFYSDPISGFRD